MELDEKVSLASQNLSVAMERLERFEEELEDAVRSEIKNGRQDERFTEALIRFTAELERLRHESALEEKPEKDPGNLYVAQVIPALETLSPWEESSLAEMAREYAFRKRDIKKRWESALSAGNLGQVDHELRTEQVDLYEWWESELKRILGERASKLLMK